MYLTLVIEMSINQLSFANSVGIFIRTLTYNTTQKLLFGVAGVNGLNIDITM